MTKAVKFFEFFSKESYKEKDLINNVRGQAYALFKYLEAVDNKLTIDKPMDKLERDSVLYNIKDLFNKLSDSYEYLKKDMKGE